MLRKSLNYNKHGVVELTELIRISGVACPELRKSGKSTQSCGKSSKSCEGPQTSSQGSEYPRTSRKVQNTLESSTRVAKTHVSIESTENSCRELSKYALDATSPCRFALTERLHCVFLFKCEGQAISNGCMATDLEYLKLAHEKRLAKTTVRFDCIHIRDHFMGFHINGPSLVNHEDVCMHSVDTISHTTFYAYFGSRLS